MDKIHVLWIEDNPLQESLLVRDLVNRDPILKDTFPEHLYDYPIPAIHFDADFAGHEKHFNLQVLQHPLENKDFISMCLRLEDRFGFTGFNKVNEVVPEVIAFDYHFGEKITVNQGNGAMSYFPVTRALREYINPIYRFLENTEIKLAIGEPKLLLEQPEWENYTQQDFLTEISRVKDYLNREKDEKDLITDDFGLLTAVEILHLFRGHSVVAIPTTFAKNLIDNLSLHGKYFEWLNEHDYTVDFTRPSRGEKKWDHTLKDAMMALQKKLVNDLRLGKIFVAYSHLNTLTQKDLNLDRLFEFRSLYGLKRLPLDGLFFYVPVQERDSAIRDWAVELCSMFSQQTGVSYSDYREASDRSQELLDAYATDLVDKRIELSKLVVQYLNGSIAENDEKLIKLMKFFGVGQTHVQAFKEGKGAKYHRITKEFRDFRTVSRSIGRLVALMTDLRLHSVYQKFIETNVNSKGENRTIRLLKQPPTYDDLLFALFPVPQSPLVLPYHLEFLENVFDETTMKAKMRQPYEGWDTVLDNLKLRKGGVFPDGLTDAEISLSKSFALDLKLKSEFFPNWLKG